ncbi:MAG: hypothetical protein CSA96_04065 [Bacteroidetes bacterium]|nr:MAG: hypothetical protein CSA96_04065 [Bacteroidota bacterium]
MLQTAALFLRGGRFCRAFFFFHPAPAGRFYLALLYFALFSSWPGSLRLSPFEPSFFSVCRAGCFFVFPILGPSLHLLLVWLIQKKGRPKAAF